MSGARPGLTAALVLCLAALGRAGDEDPPDAPEAPPPPEECLRVLGRGGEWEVVADGFLAQHPAPDVTAAAARALEDGAEPALLVGAAAWLGRPAPNGLRDPAPARVVTRRLAASRDPRLQAALLEALGAVGQGPDLDRLADLARTAEEPDAAAALAGLTWCPVVDGAVILVQLASTLQSQLELTASQTEPAAEPSALAPGSAGAEEGTAGEAQAAPALTPEQVRQRWVLGALGRLAASPRAVLLVEAVQRHSPPPLMVLQALAGVRSPDGRRALARLTRELLSGDEPAAVRAQAVRLLVTVGDVEEAGVEALVVTALSAQDAPVRASAAGVVHRLGLLAALPRLVALLDDPAAEVREAAHASLCAFARRKQPALRRTWELWLQNEAPKPAPAE